MTETKPTRIDIGDLGFNWALAWFENERDARAWKEAHCPDGFNNVYQSSKLFPGNGTHVKRGKWAVHYHLDHAHDVDYDI